METEKLFELIQKTESPLKRQLLTVGLLTQFLKSRINKPRLSSEAAPCPISRERSISLPILISPTQIGMPWIPLLKALDLGKKEDIG